MASVSFTNTDISGGSDDDVIISGPVYVDAISVGIGLDGTTGAGQILEVANSNASVDGVGGTVILSAGSGIGIPGTSIDITDVATLDATTMAGGIYVDNSSILAMTLHASTSNGNIDVSSSGEIDLSDESSGTGESVYTTGTVTLDAGGAIVVENGTTVYAGTLVLTATDGIGTSSSPLETSSPGTLTLTASAGDGLFLDNDTALTVNSATAGNGDLSITAKGNLTLAGNVSSANGNVTLTATDGTLTTVGTGYISADSLTITAEQIGSTTDDIQTYATTINVTANLRRHLPQQQQQRRFDAHRGCGWTGPQQWTDEQYQHLQHGQYRPSPADDHSDQAGHYATRGGPQSGRYAHAFSGRNALTVMVSWISWNNSATVTSADAGDTAPYYDVWTGQYDIDNAQQFSDNFSTSNSGGLDTNWDVVSGTFTVNTASQTATATGASGTSTWPR